MTMKVVGRMNIGGDPKWGNFVAGGKYYYRPTNTTMRVADFEAGTDVQLTNAINVGGGYSVLVGVRVIDGYAASWHGVGGGSGGNSRFEFVNISTGAVTTLLIPDPGPGNGYTGDILIVNSGGVNKACFLQSVGGAITQKWTLAPPAHGIVAAAANPATLLHSRHLSRGNFNGLPVLFAVGNYANPCTYQYMVAGINTAVSPYNLAVAGEYGAGGNYYGGTDYNMQRFPWYADETSDYFYLFSHLTTVPRSLGFCRVKKSNNARNVQVLGNMLNGDYKDASAFTADFGRLYYPAPGSPARLVGTFVETFPILQTDYIDIDGGPEIIINNILIEPPFLYVAKRTVGGATYGNQIVKIYDSKLGNRQHYSIGTKPKMRFR